MPIYEYECESCRSGFERLERKGDKPLNVCPACGGKVHKLVTSAGGFIFKGEQQSTDQSSTTGTRCGNIEPCCGRDTPCEIRPCD